ncbi:hypothetical protein SNE40_006029 [Patella caerulea]|uniref:Ig-like domain-containing protein n=1 Tax=Patella caerulea TaxID=87958 RepID=A0AAN8K6M3_PATCE
MNPYTLLTFLLYSHVIAGVQGSTWWFKPGNDEYSSLSGCNIELIWNILIKDHTTTIAKTTTPEHKLNDDERYVIYSSESEQGQDISLIIPHATVNDSGVYRCTVDYTPRHKDINVNVTDFIWMPDKTSIEVQEGEDINLEWKYVTRATFKSILVYRISYEDSRKQYLGNLTADNMDNQEQRRVGRFSVTVNKDGDGVVLTLRKVTEEDVKYNYFIELVYSDTCLMKSGPTFLNKESKVYSRTPVIKSRRQEDINFVWYYEYISPVITILFTRRTPGNEIDKIGYWHDGEFEPQMADGESRLKFNQTEGNVTNVIKGQITLTLLAASMEDFNYDYICRIIFRDKQESSWNILLEEKAPLFVKDGSGLSTGEVAGIAVSVVVGIVILVVILLILVIVLSRRSEFVRQKIQSYTGGNNIDKENQAEINPLRGSNIKSEDEAPVEEV